MINVEHLSKWFGTKQAVKDVSFAVQRGEVLGFLGPNGAGKSTTMRMITGFITPSAGRMSIGGHDIASEPIAARRLLGYLPESAPAYPDMTVFGFLKFVAEIRGLTGDTARKAIHRAAELCFLENVLTQSVDTLSKGYKHRTCFAQAIIHDPDVLIMDEPTDGLDPNQKHEVRQLIKRMGEKKAIIFSTHILEEVEAACTRAIIIDRGSMVADGTPAELKARSENAGAVSIRIHGVAAATVKESLGSVGPARNCAIVREESGVVHARVYPRKDNTNGELATAVAESAVRQNWKFNELHTEEGRLDDVFRSITTADAAPKA